MRIGVIAEKLGMSAIYTDNGVRVPVTLLKFDDCHVVDIKTKDRDGYSAVQLGVGKAKVKNVSKSLRGHFAKAKVEAKKKLVEFRVEENGLVQPGTQIIADHFSISQFVDVTGYAIGKGFAGSMKRHNFLGLEASHGVSISHRSHGSTGQRQDPGKVFKGKKMAGHLGADKVTVQNLQVVSVNNEQGIILVKGAVPGNKGNYVIVRDAVKRVLPEDAKFPAGVATKLSDK